MSRILAWAGGVIFVFSLAYTLYFYGLILGNATPAGASSLWRAALLDTLLFGVFAVHHSLFARERVKVWITRIVPPHMERSAYVWIASLLLIATWVLWRLVPGTVYEFHGAVRWPFYLLQLAGIHLTVRGARIVDPLELAGIRQAAREAEDVAFRTDGPFGLVRHPIYLGWILMVFGTPTMTVNRMMFAIITSAYLVVAIPWEEKSLLAAFGDRYRAYQAGVRWRLIPGIW